MAHFLLSYLSSLLQADFYGASLICLRKFLTEDTVAACLLLQQSTLFLLEQSTLLFTLFQTITLLLLLPLGLHGVFVPLLDKPFKLPIEHGVIGVMLFGIGCVLILDVAYLLVHSHDHLIEAV